MKKIFAVLLLLALAPFAHASSFTDVSDSAWYSPFVEELVTGGVIEAGGKYNPERPMTRGDLMKVIITAIGGMEDYIEPVIPSFDDVKPEDPNYNFIEAAAQLGIVEGYTDGKGNPIHVFGQNDPLNRAAATKILVKAFGIQVGQNAEAVFPDVKASDWFFDYVMTAYNHQILSGYEDGRFGPADPVTRAQVAKLVANARADFMGTDNTEEPGTGETQNPLPTDNSSDTTSGNEALQDAEPNLITIEPVNLAGGVTGQFMAKYNFHGRLEGFDIQTLTVVNDTVGNNLGDQVTSTTAIKSVTLRYPDKAGKLKTVTQDFPSSGEARFSDLAFFAPRDTDAFLEIYADINPFSVVGESLSGQAVRLGLKNVNNDSESFRAIGQFSNDTIGYGSSFLINDGGTPEIFVVRKSVPTFAIAMPDGPLSSGERDLMKFTISASEKGSVSFGRLTFDISVSDNSGADLNLDEFRFFRGSNLLDDEVMIYDAVGGSDVSPMGAGTIGNGLSRVIVSFNQEETISAGQTIAYYLKANLNQVASGDSVTTNLGRDDEATALIGLTANTTPNTGRIFVNGDATDGIFTNATDFANSLGTARNIIWSDKSASNHHYGLTDGGSSFDFTNGYLLNLVNLSSVTLNN